MTAQEPEPRVEVTWRPAPMDPARLQQLLRALFDEPAGREAVDDAARRAS